MKKYSSFVTLRSARIGHKVCGFYKFLLMMLLMPVIVSCGSNSSSGNTVVSANTGNNSSVIELAVAPLPGNFPLGNNFDNTALTEASGLQRSLLLDNIYYVHNDSGSSAAVYATDVTGQVLGSIFINGVASVDWEAIAAAEFDGKPHLIVADIGDNDQVRNNINFLVFEEPDLRQLVPGFNIDVSSTRLAVSYADGLSYDAEALFVGSDNDTVVLLTKNSDDASGQLIWTASLSNGLNNGGTVLEYAGTIALPSGTLPNAITGADIHPDGRELAVLTYGLATGRVHLWTLQNSEGVTEALVRPADTVLNVPFTGSNFQAEGVSYSSDGSALLVVAEGRTAQSTITVIAR